MGIVVLTGTQWKKELMKTEADLSEWGGKDRLDCKPEAILYAA